jgi:hypothetical protein
MGTAGSLGQRAPGWISTSADFSWLGLFAWIALSSVATRDASPIDRWLFRLGVALVLAVAVAIAATSLLFFLVPGYVETGFGILPAFLVGLVIWLSPVAWLLALAFRLWMFSGTGPQEKIG